MALTKEDLQAIQGLLEPINIRLGTLETGQAAINDRLDGMETRLDRMETRMDALESRMDVMESKMEEMQGTLASVHKSQMMYESTHFPKISVALDGYAALSEKSKAQDKKISALNTEIERCNIDITYLKSVAQG